MKFVDRVNNAQSKHLYMDVNKLSHNLTITGAPIRFKSKPDDIYVPKYRLVGDKESILDFLESQNIKNIGTYYTKDNYNTTLFDQYNKEVELRKSYINNIKENESQIVDDLVANVDNLRLRLPGIFTRNNKKSTKKPRNDSNKSADSAIVNNNNTEEKQENEQDNIEEKQENEQDNIEEEQNNNTNNVRRFTKVVRRNNNNIDEEVIEELKEKIEDKNKPIKSVRRVVTRKKNDDENSESTSTRRVVSRKKDDNDSSTTRKVVRRRN